MELNPKTGIHSPFSPLPISILAKGEGGGAMIRKPSSLYSCATDHRNRAMCSYLKMARQLFNDGDIFSWCFATSELGYLVSFLSKENEIMCNYWVWMTLKAEYIFISVN